MKRDEQKSIQIIKEAKKLFFRFGLKKVSVEEICSNCKIGKKTFYKIFPNKYEVAKAIIIELEELHLVYYEEVKREPISFKEKMIKMINKKVESINTVEFQFFRDVYENCDELREFTEGLIKESERETFEFISAEQSSGALRKDLPARFMSYMLNEQARKLIMDPEVEKMIPETNDRIKGVVDIIVNGLVNSSIDTK
tara:strand:- start:10012 stop:10602 length:591 start_codon:yes stop_codon:yes gene_type:complete